MHPNHIGYLLKVINDKLKVRADQNLSKHQLTFSQSRVLACLNKNGGIATQKEIEEFLEVSHPTIVGIISRMEQNGHVTTWIDSKNRRNKMVALTDQSRRIGEHLDCMISAQEETMLRGLSPAQVKELEQMLHVIYKNL